MSDYESYVEQSLERLQDSLETKRCRPVLLAGAGLSRRYIGAPSWMELLEYLVDINPRITTPSGYFAQQSQGNLPRFATYLIDDYHEWGWAVAESSRFPDALYEGSQSKDVFLKHQVANYFEALHFFTDPLVSAHEHYEEIQALRQVNPHAVITTNYDRIIELVFEQFTPIVGQQILTEPDYVNIGEIFKIHGCISQISSLVLTEEDYANFMKKRKYLIAKMLTYFAEHPIVILGYSFSDTNVRKIFSDLAEALPIAGDEVIENVWFIEWQEAISSNEQPPQTKVLDIGEDRTIRVNYLKVSSFTKVFETLAQPVSIGNVNIKLLRNLQANIYSIVKNTSARPEMNVNLVTLNEANDLDTLQNMLGIGVVAAADYVPAFYPLSLTDVAEEIGGSHWSHANHLIEKVSAREGFDIKESNNVYHQVVPGGKQHIHRYSHDCVELLGKVKSGGEYEVDKSTYDIEGE